MYDYHLDIDFSKICKKPGKYMKTIQDKLFNDDLTDVDPEKLKKIFINAENYVDTFEKPQKLQK